jgi:hypothetical protein
VADTITISVKLGVEVVGKHIRITNGTDRTTYTIYFRRNNTIVISVYNASTAVMALYIIVTY